MGGDRVEDRGWDGMVDSTGAILDGGESFRMEDRYRYIHKDELELTDIKEGDLGDAGGRKSGQQKTSAIAVDRNVR